MINGVIELNKYIDKGDYYEMVIYGNKNDGTVLIDKSDYEKVSKYTWYIKDDSSGKGYVAAKINKKTTKLHRYLLDVTDRKDIVDHIDRNKLNNRRSNLRITNSTINNLNISLSKNNTSGRTGVKFAHGRNGRSDKWVANMTINGVRKSKAYSIALYGEEAYNMAVKQREEWEEEYNVTGKGTFND